MNEITLTVFFKGIGMLAAILGGILIARWGFHLYKDGAGSNSDHAAFEVGSIKLKSKSVGSVVMSTAFLWVYAGVLLSPNIDKDGENYKVTSINAPDINFEGIELVAELPNQEVQNNAKELKEIFTNTLLSAKKTGSVITIDGEPVKYALDSIKALASDTGEIYFTTKVSVEDKSATIAYEPSFDNDMVIFRPVGVSNNIKR